MAEARPPLVAMSDAELEQALRGLGPHLAFPSAPDLTAAVRGQIDGQMPDPIPFMTRRRLLWLAAVLLVVIAGTLALLPGVRTAIADRLGLRGVGIQWVEEIPTPPPSPIGAQLTLGRLVSLDEARAAVDFPVHVPTAAGFADPPEVYVLGLGENAMVSFVYPPGPQLLPSVVPNVGALLTQFQGYPERNLIQKGLRGDEEGATRLEGVNVGRHPGFWIAGVPHAFYVCPEPDQCREERFRLAGNVLLWEQDGLTFRLESALSKEESLVIAESVRAPE